MKSDNAKRYLITYSDEITDSAKVAAILGVAKDKLHEGVAFLAENDTLAKDDVLHFVNLGVSSIELSSDQAAELSKKEGILAVEEDVEMHILGFPVKDIEVVKGRIQAQATPTPMWNMNLVNAPVAWARGINGTGINLAILDTGIASHPDLVISGGISFVPKEKSYNDENGHGTHCAGIAAGSGIVAPNGYQIFGIAPKCNLYAVKVLTKKGHGDLLYTIAGMEWCTKNRIDVASMSLGSILSPRYTYSRAVRTCQKLGVVIVCASGNSGASDFPYVNSPANSVWRYPVPDPNGSPIAVGSVDANSIIAKSSSRGRPKNTDWNEVSVVAPGVKIYSTCLNEGYKIMSGTSMACPHVAGFAALLCQRYPGADPLMIKAKMALTAGNLGTAPFPNIPYGNGLINCDTSTR